MTTMRFARTAQLAIGHQSHCKIPMAHPARHREKRPETLPSAGPKMGCRAITLGLSLWLDEKWGARHVGRCPPEDVGGPSGYEEFLEIMSDTAHDSYAETRQWVGGLFDPRAADLTQLSHAVDALAAKWSRPTTSRKTRPPI